jgi:tetratricopeptide (TPR) repeat protein
VKRWLVSLTRPASGVVIGKTGVSITLRSQLMIATACLSLMGVFGCASGPTKTATLDPSLVAASMCGKPLSDAPADPEAPKPIPLIGGLASVQYPVTSSNPDVQRYMDQGLAMLYGFEYEKAWFSFAAALKLDPDCAMCAWGDAYAYGPNINSGELSALEIRYAANPPKDQAGVHAEAYANAMIEASNRWPDDDVIMILAAEAAMTARPWDYWEKGGHVALRWGGKAMHLVETVLARNPTQPEAIHLYIHLTENSDNPRRAEIYADKLGGLAPNSAHLVHMPSHTYYPLGRFKDSIIINERAINIDEGVARTMGEDPAWYGYYFHHARFVMSAAQQVGDSTTALRIAAQLEKGTTVEKALKSEWSESNLALAIQARGQFQTPEAVLALPAPDKRLKIATLTWRAVRAEALARKGDLTGARREVVALKKAREALTSKDWQSFAQRILEMAQGRVDLASGRYDLAAGHFRAAAELEGAFDYTEPPLWSEPADIALGRTLLALGDATGAQTAFERALKVRPGNAYALWGRAQAAAKAGQSGAKAVPVRRL